VITKIRAGWDALQRGKELANVETWKSRQNLVNTLAGFGVSLVALASAFGYVVALSPDDVAVMASAIGAVVGLFNVYTTTATTKRIGLPAKSDDSAADLEPDPVVGDVPGSGHNLFGKD
jgi:hypothetical protein